MLHDKSIVYKHRLGLVWLEVIVAIGPVDQRPPSMRPSSYTRKDDLPRQSIGSVSYAISHLSLAKEGYSHS
jgi:hypothetical protein